MQGEKQHWHSPSRPSMTSRFASFTPAMVNFVWFSDKSDPVMIDEPAVWWWTWTECGICSSTICQVLQPDWRPRYATRIYIRSNFGVNLRRRDDVVLDLAHAEEGDVAATKHALDKAIGLFVKKNNLRLAAMSCVELAEFYMEYQQLQSALDSFEQAAEYYGDNRRRSRHCRFRANLLRFTLANEDMLRVKGRLPIKDYRRRFARYIKSSDPDWRAQVRELFSSTIVAPPWM